MRGFAFSMDMAFGALVVVLFLALFSQVIHPPVHSSHTLLQLQAKDAVMDWFYRTPFVETDPSFPSGVEFACSQGFRPQVSPSVLDPVQASSWVVQTKCVRSP